MFVLCMSESYTHCIIRRWLGFDKYLIVNIYLSETQTIIQF